MKSTFDSYHPALGLAEIDAVSGCFVAANGRYRALAGLGEEELSARRPEDVTLVEDRSGLAVLLERVRQGGAALEIERRQLRPDGTTRWVHESWAPARGGEGGPTARLVCACLDITERKRAGQIEAEQSRCLELIATGRPLAECLEALGEAVARLEPRARAAVLVANEERTRIASCHSARLGAGFGAGIAGVPINELLVGTCGTAIFRGRPVACADIARDERWSAGWRELCLAHGVRACHSTPVLRPEGRAEASFFLALAEAREPEAWEVRIAEFGARLAGIALERERAGEALRESEARFRALADEAPLCLWMADAKAGVTYANRTLRDYLGVGGAEAFTGRAWEAVLHPDDVAPALAAYAEAPRERRPYELELRYQEAASGDHRWHLVRGAPRFVSGGFAGYIGVAVDIHDRKRAEAGLAESEEKLRRIFEAAKDYAILSMDTDGRFNAWNPGAGRLFGHAEEEVRGRHFQLIFTPEDRAEHAPSRELELARERGLAENERWHLRKDGGRFFASGYTQPIHDESGRLVGYTKICQDRTAHQETREALAESERRHRELAAKMERVVAERTAALREKIGELEAFSYSVSHDMRAPLRSMQGFARVLLEDHAAGLDAEGRDYLGRIERAAGRLDLLVRDVLAYSKLAKGEFPSGPVALAELLRETVEAFHFPEELVELAEPLPVVRGHEALLTQIFSNLIGNALKFARPGTAAAVRVRAERRGEMARVWVEDNGIGIAAEHFRRIFEIFGRVHPDKFYEGTGIGLAIVRKAAERLGGRAGVESSPGKGSRFWVELPAAE